LRIGSVRVSELSGAADAFVAGKPTGHSRTAIKTIKPSRAHMHSRAGVGVPWLASLHHHLLAASVFLRTHHDNSARAVHGQCAFLQRDLELWRYGKNRAAMLQFGSAAALAARQQQQLPTPMRAISHAAVPDRHLISRGYQLARQPATPHATMMSMIAMTAADTTRFLTYHQSIIST
jgi:hypothetical protein